jgi:membrane protein YdbS with pleckstrin-like domain
MRETKSIIIKPSNRAMAVNYAFSLFISALFIVATIIEITTSLEAIRLDTNFGISGLIMSLLILAIVSVINLWMKSTTYTITERDARACFGLLVKFDDCIQLSSVTSIRVTQGRLQRVFNIGNLTLCTTNFTTFVLWDINEPEAWKEEIWNLVAKAKIKTRYATVSPNPLRPM